MIIDVEPSPVNSVHRPIEYVYDFEAKNLSSVANVGGFAKFTVASAYVSNPVVGQQIHVVSGTYAGYHTITIADSSTVFTTDTVYVSNQSGVNVKFIRIPEIKVYSGYAGGEEYPTELPLTLIATFTPIKDINVQLSFDISGFLKSIFLILPPTIGIDFNLFNRFRLYFDGDYQDAYMVVNAAIPTDVLNETYVGTGVYLNSSDTPIIFQCGLTILSLLDVTGVITNSEVENGDTGADYFYDDYDDNDYLTQNS